MVGEENSQKVWSLFTCGNPVQRGVERLWRIQLPEAYHVGFLNDNQGYNRQRTIQGQNDRAVSPIICEEV